MIPALLYFHAQNVGNKKLFEVPLPGQMQLNTHVHVVLLDQTKKNEFFSKNWQCHCKT